MDIRSTTITLLPTTYQPRVYKRDNLFLKILILIWKYHLSQYARNLKENWQYMIDKGNHLVS